MRCFAAALLIGALIFPGMVKALDCGGPSALWYQAADGVDTSVEQQRRDAQARALLERLERAPIIFRGRIASARYLRKRNDPTSLIVFDHVEILKGRLPKVSMDRKAFIIQELWCDGGCSDQLTQWWPLGETVVVAAYPNDFVGPSKAVKFPRIIYKGRIDAVVGMCGPGRLWPAALELLNNPDEIARLKREYLPRRPQ
jgi:hypothetical protein